MKLSLSNVDYIIEDYKPKICLICRNEEGRRVVIKRDYFPYCYVDKEEKKTISFVDPMIWFEETNLNVAGGGEVTKVYAKYPKRIGDLKNKFKRSVDMYEADILFSLRYIIDKGIVTGIDYDSFTESVYPTDADIKLKKVFLDIETYSEETPDITDTNDKIIVCGFFDKELEEYVLFVSNEELKIPLTEELRTDPKKVTVFYFENERAMLTGVNEYLHKLEPDVIITFTTFDMSYFVARCEKLDIVNTNRLSPVHSVYRRAGEPRVLGVTIFDLADGYRQVVGESKWGTLHDISMKELSIGRKYHDVPVHITWKKNPEHVVIRNLMDVELIKELDKECNILAYYETIKEIVGCNINDGFLTSRLGDILYLRKNYGKIILPIRKGIIKRGKYPGAIVFPSNPGIYKNILVLDWKQMYPSIIRTWNIGWETYRKDGSGDLSIDDKWTFSSKTKSWTVEILDDLQPLGIINKKKQRDAEKIKDWKRKKLLEKEMWGLKSIINGVYGLFGFAGDWVRHQPAARLYNHEVASAITYVGRELQKGTLPLIKKLGYKVVYGDTDSIFIQLKSDNPIKEAEKLQETLGKLMQKYIEERWNVKSEQLMLDVDKIFSKVILLAKKRYTGYTIHGEKVVKGLDIVRRNTSQITIDTQNKVIDIVCKDNPNDIVEYLKEIIKKFRNKEFEVSYISMPVKLSKSNVAKYKPFTPEVQAFLYSNDYLGIDLSEGERFFLIYVKNLPDRYPRIVLFPSKYKRKILELKCPIPKNKQIKSCSSEFQSIERVLRHLEKEHLNTYNMIKWKKVKCIGFRVPSDIPEGTRIDYEAMEEKVLKYKLEDFITLLGKDWNRIIAGKTLDNYFGV